MKRVVVLLAVAAALVAVSTAEGVRQRPKLAAIASVFAERPVGVKCYLPGDESSPDGFGAWGYVWKPTGKARYMHLDAPVCEGALRINDPLVPAWQRALGPGVLIHEAYHLRRWGLAGNEAAVECKAIRHWKVGARMLGATEETVAQLWPYALAEHYELANYVDVFDAGNRPYYDPSCNVPPLFEIPEEPK